MTTNLTTGVTPTVTIKLDTPLMRGDTTISEITLRKPTAGALRGVSLSELLQLDVTALTTVLPRISEPTLMAHEVMQLDVADLVQLGGEVAGFLLPKAAKGSLIA